MMMMMMMSLTEQANQSYHLSSPSSSSSPIAIILIIMTILTIITVTIFSPQTVGASTYFTVDGGFYGNPNPGWSQMIACNATALITPPKTALEASYRSISKRKTILRPPICSGLKLARFQFQECILSIIKLR